MVLCLFFGSSYYSAVGKSPNKGRVMCDLEISSFLKRDSHASMMTPYDVVYL